MHGDAFQLTLVGCNWGRISNPRLHAAQVNALDTFLFAQKCPFDKNVTKCKSAEGSWDKYNWQNYIHISFYKSVQQTNFQKKTDKKENGESNEYKTLNATLYHKGPLGQGDISLFSCLARPRDPIPDQNCCSSEKTWHFRRRIREPLPSSQIGGRVGRGEEDLPYWQIGQKIQC